MTDNERLEKAKIEGAIELYTDDSAFLRNSVNSWNELMSANFAENEKYKKFEGWYLRVNLAVDFLALFLMPLYVSTGTVTPLDVIVKIFISYAIWAFVAVITLGRNTLEYKYEIATAATLVFLIVGPVYLINTVFGIIFCLLRRKKKSSVEQLEGYPYFSQITVRNVLHDKGI